MLFFGTSYKFEGLTYCTVLCCVTYCTIIIIIMMMYSDDLLYYNNYNYDDVL